MHDLATLQRINQQAFDRARFAARAEGYTVETQDLHGNVIGFERAPDLDAALAIVSRNPSARTVILPPLSEPERALVRGRDQSEDYGSIWHLFKVSDGEQTRLMSANSESITRCEELVTRECVDMYGLDEEFTGADYLGQTDRDIDQEC